MKNNIKYVPVKVHIKKPWMSEHYHQRIQKKWIKRHGLKPTTEDPMR